jgi:hypothetical protein
MTDDHAPPHANPHSNLCSNPLIRHGPPLPQTRTSRTDDAPINYFDADFEERERCWRQDRQETTYYVPLAQDEEQGVHESENEMPYAHRRYRHYEDAAWLECVAFWVLTCVIVMAAVSAAAFLWILVTQ